MKRGRLVKCDSQNGVFLAGCVAFRVNNRSEEDHLGYVFEKIRAEEVLGGAEENVDIVDIKWVGVN